MQIKVKLSLPTTVALLQSATHTPPLTSCFPEVEWLQPACQGLLGGDVSLWPFGFAEAEARNIYRNNRSIELA